MTKTAEFASTNSPRGARAQGIAAGGQLAVTEVALVVTIGEPSCDFPQVSLPDRLTAQRTEGFWARCPAIDQNELHAVTLNVRRELIPDICWQLIDRSTADAKLTRPKYCRHAFHAISVQGRTCSATRGGRNRKSPAVGCARYSDLLLRLIA
jgi:hypothetical protein